MRCHAECRRCRRPLTSRNRARICGVCWRPLPLLQKAMLVPPDGGRFLPLDEMARIYVRGVLDAHSGNVTAAARALGVSRGTVYRMVGGSHARGVTVQ